MRLPALLLLVAAGCYQGTGCYHGASAPPAGGPGPAAAPAGPPPRLAWTGHELDASRLPAVSADGAAVLIGIEDNDGGRGNPNYRLELRDRLDAKIDRHTVLTVDEVDALYDADGNLRGMDDRIAEANRWLADQHTVRRFTPLTELEVETGDDIAWAFRATGHGVTIEWKDSRVTIAQGGRTLVSRPTPPSWLAERRLRGSGGGTCENPAFLGSAAVSVEHKVALLTISYSGNDLCWEPSNAPHVVAW